MDKEHTMITAERLQTLTTFTPHALAQGLKQSGYFGVSFESCKFLGITNGGQFCYSVTYYDDNLGGETTDKVFLTYNSELGSVSVDY
jgi:hypothetical protein